jgi:hypothetical protein
VCEHEATRSEYTTEHMVCEDITAFRMEHHHQSSSWMHDVSTPPTLECGHEGELLLYITHKKGRTFERVGPSWMGQPHPTCGCACMRMELVRRSVELEA